MAPQEQTHSEIVQHLENGRQDLLAAVAGLSEAQAKVRPDPARWSALDCVEHITLVEDRFLGWLASAKPLETPNPDKQKEAGVLARMADRSSRAQAPDAVQPAGRFATLEEALEQFNANRNRSIQTAIDRFHELYKVGVEHPRLGPMNGMELMLLITGHARRHAAQIREARAALD
jgi:uncharacterized damage-inducible protein DinB